MNYEELPSKAPKKGTFHKKMKADMKKQKTDKLERISTGTMLSFIVKRHQRGLHLTVTITLVIALAAALAL